MRSTRSPARNVDVPTAEREQAIDELRVLLVVHVELVAEVVAFRQIGAGRGALEKHEPIRARKRERLEHDRVDDVEHPGHGADRERERADGGDEEAGRAKERAPRVAQVASGVLEPREALAVIESVLRDADVAEGPARDALRVSRRHSLCLETFHFHLEVRADLVLEVVLRAAAEHQAFSGVGPGSMTRAMDSTSRFQRPVSIVSCLATDRRERVEASAAIVVGRAPRALDPAALLESLERGVERSVVDEERVAGPRLDGDGDAVAVMRPERQHAEDEEIERSLEERISRRIVFWLTFYQSIRAVW